MTADKALKIGGGLLLALVTHSASAQDISNGQLKARMCTVCHGELGIAVVPNAPNLAGESSLYITSQLEAFKSGKRQHEQMTIVASTLNEQDIADLAAWFQAIEVSAKAPDLN